MTVILTCISYIFAIFLMANGIETIDNKIKNKECTDLIVTFLVVLALVVGCTIIGYFMGVGFLWLGI